MFHPTMRPKAAEPAPPRKILVVDDEEAIRALLGECLEAQGYEPRLVESGQEALKALAAHPFDLVLSDVRMPGMTGIELLETIVKTHEDVGVLLLTACEDVSLAVQAMKIGALDYVLKPFQVEQISNVVRKALARHQEKRQEKHYILQLEQQVKTQTLELKHTFANLQDAPDTTLEALITALDAREHETQRHSKRVAEYTVRLSRAMGVPVSLLQDIGRGAMLHDIGKIGISDTILLKPAKLTEEEWVEMRKHPQIGAWILEGIEPLRPASEIVLAHQERFDGTGYPRKLKGSDIPLGARIFSVIDCYDAMTSDRPYRKATTYEAARDEIIRCSGAQFDPDVVKYFLSVPKSEWLDLRNAVESSPRHKIITG
ncbi:MAG: response regulator [Acidobacteriia bacterium]|nr:response regulator [Terriglobia bacterium]